MARGVLTAVLRRVDVRPQWGGRGLARSQRSRAEARAKYRFAANGRERPSVGAQIHPSESVTAGKSWPPAWRMSLPRKGSPVKKQRLVPGKRANEPVVSFGTGDLSTPVRAIAFQLALGYNGHAGGL